LSSSWSRSDFHEDPYAGSRIPFIADRIAAIVELGVARNARQSCPQRAPVSLTMDTSLADLVEDWHDFDVLVGTAAATLVGLMFVAASIGASVFTEKDRSALKAFISPTVVHFTTVLVIAVVALVPTHEWHTLASLLALVGVAGAVYSVNVWIELFIHRRFNVDIVDRLFYAAIPLVGHLLLLLAALFLWRQSEAGLDLLAAGQITLLLAAIRNAWDMMIWIMIRAPTGEPGSRDDT
jgi:hypothetical protein